MILKNKISPLQFAVLLMISILGFITMLSRSMSCFTMVISVLFSFLMLIPTLLISSKENFRIPFLLKIVASIFTVLVSVYIVNEFSVFFSTLVNTETPRYFISALLLLSVLYPATKGIEEISRSSIIAVSFVILSLILIFSLLPYSDISHFSDNEKSFNISDSIGIIIAFSPALFSMLFFRNIIKAKATSVIFPFIISSLILSSVICFVKLLDISEYRYPFYTLSELSCKVIPMGFSGLFIAFSIMCVFFGVLYFSLSVKSITNCHTRLMSIVYIAIVYALSVVTLYNKNLSDIILNKYFLLVLYLIIALIIPIYVVIKEKKNEG